ncbi:hypothetical protein C1H46_045689 [Malus baccata]|uniref:Uncharacterized protein n=1 Tax=Malus baccata TaxID=106549 RepID=A0A540K3G5_MALBA|nr:hypothetical protein C1H46_045689 [Malus baccata]
MRPFGGKNWVFMLTNFPPLSPFNDLITWLLLFESKQAMNQAVASTPATFWP